MAAVGTDADTDAHIVVHRQLQDIVLVQQQQIEYLSEMIKNKEEESVSIKIYEDVVKELENETFQHAKTKSLLSKESEKLQFALGEVEILMKQLEREKNAFENALESIKNKAWKEVNKNDKLKSKCNDIENKVEKQEDILSSKEDQIKELCHQLAKQKATLKQQVTEFEIQKQQNAYIERVLEGKKKKACGKFIPTSK
ncbi:spermatogenesis-associated protein 24 isoform X1 [Amblyraja radiata]|uniref:spermatogenesis-associated protein 24 isoform X1 n=1 Tax=Amblyraja radiata TaxID=386614 RepID=UPI001403A892|nr:spermatogenesis-associated protein 24 isoform X1 [Amblyraja radiata]